MLDVYRSKAKKLEIHLSPTDILKDVFDPILHILHRRDNGVRVVVDCPEDTIVLTDSLRLKQVSGIRCRKPRERMLLTLHHCARFIIAVFLPY